MAKAKRASRIYILPTGFGALYLAGAFAMILIGSAYQNNLVNMLAFFMLSLIFVAMIQTHNNLKEVTLAAVDADGGFAGGEFLVTTLVANSAKLPRFNIESALGRIKPVSVYESQSTLPPHGMLKLRASYPATIRGRHHLSRVRLSSIFPLGLFQAWVWVEVSADYFVYPEPRGFRSAPVSSEHRDQAQAAPEPGGDDFLGHRRYFQGDSQHHIDWKAVARGRPKLVKEFTDGGVPRSAVFDWNALAGLDTEERLSQLAQWIEEARSRKIAFSLKLPNVTIPSGNGSAHAVRCLEALAVFDDRSGRNTDASAR